MANVHFPLHPLLTPCVDFLWISEHYVQPHVKERVLPTGTIGLIVDVSQDGRGATVAGARSKPFILDTSRPRDLIGVALKPGGGYPFFGPTVSELRNSDVSLDALWGQQAQDLREQLLEAVTTAHRFRILERHLLARLGNVCSGHPAVGHALNAFAASCPSVTDVTNETNLNPRRFIEHFRREVGLTPKVFCRISRFKQVLTAIEASTEPDWTEIAIRNGYYDQAHFNHEFREFAGVKPSEYLARRTSRHHVRVTD